MNNSRFFTNPFKFYHNKLHLIQIIKYKSVEGYSQLYIDNFYGEDLYGGNGTGAFIMNQGSKIIIK